MRQQPATAPPFVGNSEMAIWMRSRFVGADVASVHPHLGTVETWSPCLKTAIGILLNANSPMICVWGHHRVLFYNDACCDFFSSEQPDLAGQPMDDCLPPSWEGFIAAIEQVFSTGQTIQQHTCLVTNHGPPLELSCTWTCSPLWDETGQIGGVFAAGSDVTQHQKALFSPDASLDPVNTELQLLTDSLPLLLSFVDTEQRYRFNNQTYQDWFGQSAETTYGKHLREVVGEAGYAAIRPYVERALAGERVSYQRQVNYQNAGTRYIEATYIPRFDGQGNVIGFVALVLDISDRKRSEAERERAQAEQARLLAELTAERTRFEAVLRQMPEGVLIADAASGNLVLANQQAKQILRVNDPLDSPSLVNQQWPFFQAYHPDDEIYAPSDYPLMRSLRQGEVVTQEEMELRYSNGSQIVIEANSTPIFDDQGQITAAVAIFQDITERKRAESALQRSEAQARLAIRVGRLGTWRYSLETNQVTLDDRMREIWGESDDCEPISLPQILARIHPDDQKRVAQAIQAALDPTSSGLYEIDYRILWDDGTERWVMANGQVQFEGDGPSRQPVSFLGTALDISDRKKAEEVLRESENRFRQMTDTAPMLVWMSGLDKLCYYFNQTWLTFTGRTMEEEVGHGWSEGVHPDDFQRCIETYTTAFDARHPFEMEYRLRRFDGEFRWILDVGVPRFTPDGAFLGYIGSCFDIHDRKQAEAEREYLLAREQAAREAAEAANQIKDEFLAVLSHELRSPLNPILGWASLLRNSQLTTDKTAYALETIERNARLQVQLIDDLLDVSRILRGKLSLKIAPVNLNTVIESAIETVRLAAEVKSIQFQTLLNPGLGEVLGDAARLQQVMWNLLTNAVKFTPEGGQVTIDLEQIGSQAQIQVSDTGKGIPPDFLPHIFEYFRQADATTTRKFGGLGLGLAIVHHLVELHGGTIQADSSGEDQGATFTVRLPLMRADDGDELSESLGMVPLPKSSPLANLRILLVDDDADNRDLIAFALEQQNAVVTAVGSASEALQVYQQATFDLLISDIGMPEMDGYRLMQQIRALPLPKGPIPSIALTAYAGDVDQQQALAAGFQTHIAKPIAPSTLIRAITQLIQPESSAQ